MNFKTLALATVAAVGVTGAASAATLSIDGGSAVILNDPTNNAIFGPTAILPPGGTAFDGGKVRLNGSSSLRFTFHGREAAFNNIFEAYGNSFANNSVGFDAFSLSGFASFDTGVVADGLLDFLFRINNGATTVTNAGNGASSPNFLVSALADGSLLLWLDDKGADPEDNHDDMLIRVQVVPVPAAGFLLLGGLGAMAAMKRRRKAA